MSTVNIEAVSRAMGELLARESRPVIYRDHAVGGGPDAGCDLSVSPQAAASPTGFLPALVAAGEVVWREATGKGFALDIVHDRAALLGYRLQGIGDGTFTTVMLATMEATAQVAGPEAIVVNDLNALWAAATDRIERAERAARSESPSRRSHGDDSVGGSDSARGGHSEGSASFDGDAVRAPRRSTGAAP